MWYTCMLEMCINMWQWYFVRQTCTYRYCDSSRGGSFSNVLCQPIQVLSNRLNNNKWHTSYKWLCGIWVLQKWKCNVYIFTIILKSSPLKYLRTYKAGDSFFKWESDPNLLSQFVFHPLISHYIIKPLFKQNA